MTLHDRIDRARRNHGQVVHLQDMLVRDTCAQLQYENEMSHQVAMDMQALMSAAESLTSKAADEKSRAFVKAEIDDLLLTINRLNFIASALSGEVRS